jgi:hypothetical protein
MGGRALHVVNVLVPGSGLLLSGRALSGSLLLTASACCVTAIALVLIHLPGLPPLLALEAAGAWPLLALLAGLVLHQALARPPLDGAAVRAAHGAAFAAYLHGRLPEALAAARRLVALAPRETGAWQLLILIAEAQASRDDLARARKALARLAGEVV